jgi:hypothetical protein
MIDYAVQLHPKQKQPNLKLKTRPEQLLGSLPLAFALLALFSILADAEISMVSKWPTNTLLAVPCVTKLFGA